MMKQLLFFLTLVLILSVPCSQYLSAQQESAEEATEPDSTLKTRDDFEESELNESISDLKRFGVNNSELELDYEDLE